MKRFSKIVSRMVAAPRATELSAVNCACMSVGNAGNGAVATSTAASRRAPASTPIQSGPVVTSVPASASLSSTVRSWSGRASMTLIRPPVMAAATR